MPLSHLSHYESWVLNEETCQWESPVPYPTDGVMYQWNEELADWQATVNE
jgi:glycine cleavage system H lipoate-binding protein